MHRLQSITRRRPLSAALLALASLGVWLVVARHGGGPPAAESAYLGLLVAVAAICLAFLAERASEAIVPVAVLATLALVPSVGGSRAVAAGGVVAGSLGWLLAGRLRRAKSALSLEVAVPAAVGLQLLFRSDRLLQPDAWAAVTLALLPSLAAVAAVLLCRHRPRGTVLVAMGALLLVGSGFGVLTTLAPLGLALALELSAGVGGDRLEAALAWTAAAALLALAVWREPWWAAALLACCLGIALRRPAAHLALVGLLGTLAWLAPAARDPRTVLESLWVLPLLLPGLMAVRRDSLGPLAVGLAAAFLALRAVPETAALGPALVLLAFSSRREGAAHRLQGVWTVTLLAAAGLAAVYPWLRPEPLESALGFLGAGQGWRSAGAVWIFFAAVLAAGRLWRRATVEGLGQAVVGLTLLLALLPPSRPLNPRSLELTAAAGEWTLELPEATPWRSLAVDTYLANAASVALGTPVARVRVADARGFHLERVLLAGEDTGEWAARRPDVAALAAAPEHWISWVPSGREFFAQRYRTLWRLRGEALATRVSVRREPGLPEDVQVALFHVGLRP